MGFGRKGDRVAKTPSRLLPPSRGGRTVGFQPFSRCAWKTKFQAPDGLRCVERRNQFQGGMCFTDEACLTRDAKFFGEARTDKADGLHGYDHA